MQTENLVNNSDKKFYVILNTNQIKLYTYPDLLRKNPLLSQLRINSLLFRWDLLPRTYTTFLSNSFRCNSH